MRTLDNYKLALITGASSGLGKSLQTKLEALSIKVFAPTRADGYDLCNLEEKEKVLSFIRKNKPDLVLNCAGLGLYGDAIDLSIEEQRTMIRLNIEALSDITLEAAKTLVHAKKEGVILNVSSGASFDPWPGFAAYGATKSFVTNYSQALDFELKPKGVRVLCACPGMFSSPFSIKASKGRSKFRSPLLITTPERIADEILHQITKKKSLYIPTKRYRLLLSLAKLIPDRFRIRLFAKIIRNSWDSSH